MSIYYLLAPSSCLDKRGKTYGETPQQVINLTQEAICALIEKGVIPILKRAPG